MKHLRNQLVLQTIAILITVCTAYSSPNCETQVSFDTHPVDTFGSAYGDIVGNIVFSESGIDVRIDSMLWNNGNRGYNYVEIEEVDCGFGYDQRAWFNNASLIFDLSSIETEGLSFIFWDNGGEENLQVNGATEFVVGEFKDLPSVVAPGVTCVVDSIYKDNCYGGEIGRLTLIGDVNELRIAGQELAVDSICIDTIIPVEIPDDFECETQVSFDNHPIDTFGSGYGDIVGDIVFSESGIDIRIDSMLWISGNRGYNYVEIEEVDCGFGYDQRAWFNNASLIFDLSSIPTEGLSFIFWDNGGEENLQVNGATEFVVGEFKDLPSVVAPGVTCVVDSIYKDNCYGGEIGRLTLLGDINELRIAGQELAVDSICIDTIIPVEIPDDFECETQVSFDTHPVDTFGSAYGDVAGDIVFSESGIDVRIDSMLWNNGNRGYHYVEVQTVDCGFGYDQRVWFNNASLIFDLSSIPTDGVSFIFWDNGGEENLQVNGATEFVVGEFKDLPSVVAPGVTCVVDSIYKDNCYGGEIGRLTLLGEIEELRIAGQELAVDSLCIDKTVIIDLEDVEYNNNYNLTQNYPNPFSTSTFISYTIPEAGNVSLKIFDIHGREIHELVNEYQVSNATYTVEFNAEQIPAGIYFYRLQVNELVDIKKMLKLR